MMPLLHLTQGQKATYQLLAVQEVKILEIMTMKVVKYLI